MAAKTGKLERRRERILELLRADPMRSSRSIAAEVGCSPHTVIRQRELHVQWHDADSTPASAHPGSANLVPPAGPDNDRAVTHGAYSQKRREPLEDMHRERLRLEFPNARNDLINSAAKRCAMADLFSSWLADAGLIHRGRGGLPSVSDAAKELRILLRDHETAIAQLTEQEAEATKADPQAVLDAYVAGLSDDQEEVDDGE